MTLHSNNFDSSMVESATFDDERRILTVRMKHGAEYTTHGVSNEQWRTFLNADSPGRWFNAEIRGRK